MKLNSKFFDMIRIYRPPAAAREEAASVRCQWQGCRERGCHRAPKGRGRDGEFFVFCAEHVRRYNSAYDYFEGMSEAEVADFQKEAVYGHRPTWKVGVNAWSSGAYRRATPADLRDFAEAKARAAQSSYAWRARRASPQEHRRALRPLERKALESLDLHERAGKEEIKARFKALVKRHHPDANGGHRGSEEKLREIIQAYNYLKKAGLV
jgi:hypothetical protein